MIERMKQKLCRNADNMPTLYKEEDFYKYRYENENINTEVLVWCSWI